MTTPKQENWDYVLKGSASYELYEKFSKLDKDTKKSDHCKKFEQTDKKYSNKATELCNKINQNLDHLHKIVVPGTRRYDCLHYKYWLNNEIINMFKNGSETNYDSGVLEKFLNVQKTFIEEKKYYGCKYEINTTNFKYLEEMNERKDLNDYFNNYNTIIKKINCKSGNVDKFKEYVNHIKELYLKYKVDCLDQFDYWLSDCRYYFRRGDEFDPEILLSKLECPRKDSEKELASMGETGSVKSVPKKRMTFHYLKCKNNFVKDPIMCELVPVTMEYADNKNEVKENDKVVRKRIYKPPDPWSTFGGILHKRSKTVSQKPSEGDPNDSQADSDVPDSDPSISEFLTEADGVSPYLVLTDDEIKWRILDSETLDCRNYQSEDTYGLCKRLEELKKEGKIKLQPKPSSYSGASDKEASRENLIGEGADSLNEGSDEMEEDYANSSNTGDDIYTLLKSRQFRTGTVTFLMLGTAFLGYSYYKFTPVGSWFRKRKERKNEIDYEYYDNIANQLFQQIGELSFTPVGSWFRKRKERKNEIDYEYYDNIANQLFQPSSKSVNTNSRRKRVQIAYHQSGD
ncbi:PIR protein [Plasmodium vivax]|uniref:VIR protein n=1 Tax=Plasmodium vivax TaxID=5855 RepID=A0A565A578_PLAVI|nr:PIR protein [Plasmodium vivax]